MVASALVAEIDALDGNTYRWDANDLSVENRPGTISCATQDGDGFAEGGLTLRRQFDGDYSDLVLGATARLVGPDGDSAYEGVIAAIPRSGRRTFTVSLVGPMGAYSRRRAFQEVYVDNAPGSWGAPSLNLRTAIANAGHVLEADYSGAGDQFGLHFTGPTDKLVPLDSQAVLMYQMPAQLGIGRIDYIGRQVGDLANVDAPKLHVTDDDTLDIPAWAESNTQTLDGTLYSFVPASAHPFAAIRVRSTSAHTPTQAHHRDYSQVAVYGAHTVPIQARDGSTGGVLASEVLRDLIRRFCPQLSDSAVEDTDYPIAALAFLGPTEPYDAFTVVNDYHGWHLGAYEGGAVAFRPYDLSRPDWQVRYDQDGVDIELQGDSLDDVFNGVSVFYTDLFTGRPSAMYPPDFPTILADDSPANPINRMGGQPKWKTVDASSLRLTAFDALHLGSIALQEYSRPRSPGRIGIRSGYIIDAGEQAQAPWRPRCGQTIAITDHPNDSPRLITATGYDHAGPTLALTLEQPSQRVDKILSRLASAQTAAQLG